MKKSRNEYIRKATGLIVRRGTEYLVARIMYSTEYRWSSSPWEAWRCRDRETARQVARRLGGELWLFNAVTGELREAKV